MSTHVLLALLEYLIHSSLPQQVILHLPLPQSRSAHGTTLIRRSGVHPIKLVHAFLPGRLFLHTLELGELAFLLLFLPQLGELLLFVVLFITWTLAKSQRLSEMG